MAVKVVKKIAKANKPAKTVKKEELEEDEDLVEEEDEVVEDEVDEDEEDVEDEVDEDEEEEEAPKKSKKSAKPVKAEKKSSKKSAPKKAEKKEAPKKAEKKSGKLPKIVIEGNAMTVDDKANNLKARLEAMDLASIKADEITKADADRIFKAVEAIQVAALQECKTFKIGDYSVNRKSVSARVYPAVSAIEGMEEDTLVMAHTEMTLKVSPDKETVKGKKVKDGQFKTSDGKTVKY